MPKYESGSRIDSAAANEQISHLVSTGQPTMYCVAAGIFLLQSLKAEGNGKSVRVAETTPMLPITGPDMEEIEWPGSAMSIEVYRYGLDEVARQRRTKTTE